MKPRGLYVLDPNSFGLIYGPEEQRDIAAEVEIIAPPIGGRGVKHPPELLANVDLIFSGWGGPTLDKDFLDAAPNLKAFFYAAGGMQAILTPAVWERDILVTRAIHANSIPVAEFALSAILYSLKHGWRLARETRRMRRFPDRNEGVPGCYGSTVGLVSLGWTGRALAELLRHFDLQILACDPNVSEEEMSGMGIAKRSLDQLFVESDVVSLHTPVLPETIGMVTGRHIASMKAGATLINTARGEIVREAELIEALHHRPDLQAILDVTIQEPPEAGSPLYRLENVVLTPHIAGSVGRECRRMGRYMVEELARYLAGKPLKYAVTQQSAPHTSHRPVGIAGSTPVGDIRRQVVQV